MSYMVHVYTEDGLEIAIRPQTSIVEAQTDAHAQARTKGEGCYAQVRGWRGVLIMDTRNAKEGRTSDSY